MKRFLLGLALLGFPSLAMAIGNSVWLSSNTATADTTKNLCPGITYTVASSSYTSNTYTSGNRGIFHAACVNTGASGTLTVYNSSATATSPIAAINTTTAQICSQYDVEVSSGLTYTNSATANVTILYQCY